jgi:geranylgeranyl reductase family protein
MDLYFDVIIAGGGPAGCSCALALHNKGYKVALIDKASFPRDKICGDAIPGQSFRAFHSINPNWEFLIKQFAEQTEIKSSKVFLSNKIFSYKWKLYASNSKRIDFDNFLIGLVGSETKTTIFQSQQVTAVSTNKHNVTCTLKDGSKINASIVIGCDGSNSIVKRCLVKKENKNEDVYAALRIYYTGIAGCKTGENEFHYLKEVNGYFWIFPLPNNAYNVGFGVLKRKKQKQVAPTDSRKILEKVLSSEPFKTRFENAVNTSKLVGHGLPVWKGKQALSGERFMLAGDAACLVDPLQGHGIDKAIWSGIIAASHVVKCFAANRFDAAFNKNYDKEINKSIGKELNRNYHLMHVFVKFPFLIKLFVKLNPSQNLINWLLNKIKL